MTVKKLRGLHRRPKHPLTRTLATALLITLLISATAVATTDRPATYSVTEER